MQKTMEFSQVQFLIRPCHHAATVSAAPGFLRSVHRQGVEDLRRVFSPHFAAFFALRPIGRRVPVLC